VSYTPADVIKDPEVYRELQKISEEFNAIGQMRVFYREPLKPRDGFFCLCDGVQWNPVGNGIKQPVWFDADSSTWFTFAVVP